MGPPPIPGLGFHARTGGADRCRIEPFDCHLRSDWKVMEDGFGSWLRLLCSLGAWGTCTVADGWNARGHSHKGLTLQQTKHGTRVVSTM